MVSSSSEAKKEVWKDCLFTKMYRNVTEKSGADLQPYGRTGRSAIYPRCWCMMKRLPDIASRLLPKAEACTVQIVIPFHPRIRQTMKCTRRSLFLQGQFNVLIMQPPSHGSDDFCNDRDDDGCDKNILIGIFVCTVRNCKKCDNRAVMRHFIHRAASDGSHAMQYLRVNVQ